ncbi:MAG: cysteine hydrolase [Oscillospiraceae bacterium]|nr:cysteine hydrolase [Oscillospiraceae bacterium]
MKALIVIDMQKDFTTGALGNPETAAVVKPVADYIRSFRSQESDGAVIATMDTHFENYMETQEGRHLPVPHCIRNTEGWALEEAVAEAMGEQAVILEKKTFGAIHLPEQLQKYADQLQEIQMVGVCTDICVISNAMILKAAFPEVPIRIIANCCAGVTPQSHKNALSAMAMCQMTVVEQKA